MTGGVCSGELDVCGFISASPLMVCCRSGRKLFLRLRLTKRTLGGFARMIKVVQILNQQHTDVLAQLHRPSPLCRHGGRHGGVAAAHTQNPHINKRQMKIMLCVGLLLKYDK